MRLFGKRFLWCSLLLPLALATNVFAEGTIQGKVSYLGKGLAGATVLLYDVAGERISGPADYQVLRTEEDGSFAVLVKPGQYFLLAQKAATSGTDERGEIFSYYGGNPVVVGEGEIINVGVNGALVESPEMKKKAGGTGVRG